MNIQVDAFKNSESSGRVIPGNGDLMGDQQRLELVGGRGAGPTYSQLSTENGDEASRAELDSGRKIWREVLFRRSSGRKK